VLISRDEFERLKTSPPETLTDIQRAARFLYLQQMAFDGHIDSPTFGYAATRAPKLNLLRIEEELSAAHLRLSRAYIECLPYGELIQRYDSAGSLFYIDPPYWDCENYYGKGIFAKDDFAKLAAQLASIQGKFILSLNDTAGVRETFKAFMLESVKVNYSCSNGKNMKASEVIIKNF
jgi:DNA adenine methylase